MGGVGGVEGEMIGCRGRRKRDENGERGGGEEREWKGERGGMKERRERVGKNKEGYWCKVFKRLIMIFREGI